MADSNVNGTEFSSHKMPEFSWKAGRLLASRRKLSFAELCFFLLLQNQIFFPTQTNSGMWRK